MLKFLAGSNIAGVAVAGVVVVGGAAYYQFGRSAPVVPPVVVPLQAALPQTVAPVETAGPAAQPQTENPAAQPEAVAAVEALQPTFDEVRQEADGMTIIAGQAAPDAQVRVLQDGVEVATTQADSAGKFAAIAFVVPDGKGHVLSLVQTLGDVDTVSADQIILAPRAPVQVAVAEPQAATSATPNVQPEPETPAAQIAGAEPNSEGPQTKVRQETVEAKVQPEVPQTDVAQIAEPILPEGPVQPSTVADVDAAPETIAADLVEAAPAQPQAIETQADTSLVAVAEDTTATAPAVDPAGDPAPQTPAPQKVAVLKTTQTGVELLNVPQPQAMDNVALDTISYSAAGNVQLAGRAQPDTNSVRVYLDNKSVISLQVDASGRWRGDLPGVDEGIYTLRVDEVSDAGAVTSRVETPFKREAPEVLAQAAAAQEGPLKQITVQKGATLWGIAEERYGSGLLFVNVFEANGEAIRDPNLIYPGQIFTLPDNAAPEDAG